MNQSHTPVTNWFGEIGLLTLLILCALAFTDLGCDGGVGEVAAVDEVATEAAAAAAADIAAETAADAVTETAIAGSADVALDLAGDIVTVAPFTPALDGADSAEDMVVGFSEADPDGTSVTELDSKTTGDLQLVAITTRSIYQVERAYLDVQNKRLILKAIETRGEAPTWGSFGLAARGFNPSSAAAV
jgi:hypothetical protein